MEADKRTHESRGFNITDFHGDNEINIKSLRDSLCPLTVHMYEKYEHVGFIKKENDA